MTPFPTFHQAGLLAEYVAGLVGPTGSVVGIDPLPQKLEPLREIFRVLKRGGRLGISTGSKDHPNQLQAIKALILAREPYSRYAEALGGMPQHVSVGELERLLHQTGFEIKTSTVRPPVRYHPTPEATIAFAEASSFGNFLGHLPAELRTAACTGIMRELEQFRTPEGVRREGARIIAVALKP